MKAHKSQYFKTVLQTMIFFKFQTQAYEAQLSQGIKLMSTDELYHNIVHTKYETTLIKQIIVFLLQHLYNPQFEKTREAGAAHFFTGEFSKYRREIIEVYYTQLALAEYSYLVDNDVNQGKYANCYNFCELEESLKFALLQTLVRNVSSNIKATSKNKQKEKEEENEDKKSKIVKVEQFLVLGEDNKYAYYYAPFLSEFVITYYLGQWDLLDKDTVIERIRKILKQPMSANALFLCQSLDTVSTKFMKRVDTVQTPLRLHAVKQNYKEIVNERVRNAKKELLLINERYCKYLKNFDDQCWGYLNQRQKYLDMVEKSQSFDDLIEAFKFMYNCSCSKLFKCICDDQAEVPEDKCQEFYEAKCRPNCNIHTASVMLKSGQSIKSQRITLKIIQEQNADLYPLFQFNIVLLKKVMDHLQQKQKKYIKKSKTINAKKQKAVTEVKAEIKNGQNSTSMITKKNITSGMNLRQKKAQRNKKFGVTMIDSDQSASSSDYEKNETSVNENLKKYEYKTRSCISR